jgi:transglutaminase-like putative cysteine protease
LLLVLCLLAGRTAAADDVPGWLRDAARDASTNAEQDAEAVILYDEQQTTVKDNGEVETLYRRAYLILRTAGHEYGKLFVPFDSQTRITSIKAWCLPKQGKEYSVKEKDAAEIGFSEEFYSDLHHKVLEIPAADPGNVVGYEYVQKSRPFILQDEWTFQGELPVRRARFTLNLPGTWEFSSYWMHYTEQKPQSTTPTQTVWEVTNVPPIKHEQDMPPVGSVEGRMGVTYHPPSGGSGALGPTNWQQIGTWYAGLAATALQPTPEIEQKVRELTAGKTAWRDKLQALTSYVQSGIRYVAIEIGIGGFQPHNAADIFRHQYGDCKDKATLLRVMLHETGIESYYALAQVDRGIVTPEFASAITFNHVIVAIPIPDGESTQTLFATVTDPKLGRLLFFDPTDTYVPLGYLPSPLQENYVLVARPEGGELVRLPLLAPATNQLVRRAKLQLNPDGSLSGTVDETRLGSEASDERAKLLGAAGSERAKLLEDFLGGFLAGFHLTQASVTNLDRVGDSLGLHYQFTADRYAKSAGDLLMVRPRVLGEKSSGIAEEESRHFPVEFSEASLQTDDFEITLPPGYVVDDAPRPMQADAPFASYKSQIQVDNSKIHYTRTYQVKQVLVPVDQMEQLRRFNRQVATDEYSSVVLRKASQ